MADFDTLDSEHQGVILGFENLASKYHQVIGQKPALKTPDSETRSLIKLIDSKKDSLNRLYTHSLPLVRQQIERLLGILVRIDLDEESESQLKLVFELQPKLEHALDNLWSIREVTFLEESLNFNLPDNPDLLYHEECCLADLDNIKNNILPMIVDCFRKSCDLIKQAKFSSETAKDHNVLDSAKTSVIELRDRIYNEISETMDTLRESDFDASDRVIAYTSCLLQDFMIMKAQKFVPIPGQSSRKIDPAPLVKSIIPVTKLARLFFKKLSHRDMITEEDYYDPTRNSEELGILHDLPRTVMDDLEEFQYLSKKPFLTTRDTLHLTTHLRADEPFKHAEVLKTHFRRALTALDLSIEKIPLINGFFDQKYFQSWFTTWDTLFTISIHRFMDVIDSIQ
ncbi:hypothetical protein PSTG_05839 [Puccinia striiformis f. sp. tritici PST-78]|uniref:Uncharacterized protein n=1 Tax=Puccinia striiformis f. sp. tritici PST-78 TaxID=1165861 RepID=A0A0L0VNU8_9BASI|nr:hypothetical protein PSTG_05839 [Puccinia striiformis f. sp. tritici PST-78]